MRIPARTKNPCVPVFTFCKLTLAVRAGSVHQAQSEPNAPIERGVNTAHVRCEQKTPFVMCPPAAAHPDLFPSRSRGQPSLGRTAAPCLIHRTTIQQSCDVAHLPFTFSKAYNRPPRRSRAGALGGCDTSLPGWRVCHRAPVHG